MSNLERGSFDKEEGIDFELDYFTIQKIADKLLIGASIGANEQVVSILAEKYTKGQILRGIASLVKDDKHGEIAITLIEQYHFLQSMPGKYEKNSEKKALKNIKKYGENYIVTTESLIRMQLELSQENGYMAIRDISSVAGKLWKVNNVAHNLGVPNNFSYLFNHMKTLAQGCLEGYNEEIKGMEPFGIALDSLKNGTVSTVIGKWENNDIKTKKIYQNNDIVVYNDQKTNDFRIDICGKTLLMLEESLGTRLYELGTKNLIKVYDDSFINRQKESGNDTYFEMIASDYQAYLKENAVENPLCNYELPSDEKISYFQCFPQTYDSIIGRTLGMSVVYENLLVTKYDNIAFEGRLFSDNIADDLHAKIVEEYNCGSRKFMLDLYSHGDHEKGIGFSKEEGGALDIDFFTSLLTQYPDCEFIVTTLACFGGGLVKKLQKYLSLNPQYRDNIKFFAQTQGSNTNAVSIFKDSERGFDAEYATLTTSGYYIYLIQGLSQGMKYGEAVKYADDKIRESLLIDAESLIDGEIIGDITEPGVLDSESMA